MKSTKTTSFTELVLFLPVVVSALLTWYLVDSGQWTQAIASVLITAVLWLMFGFVCRNWLNWFLLTISATAAFEGLRYVFGGRAVQDPQSFNWAVVVAIVAGILWILRNPHYAYGAASDSEAEELDFESEEWQSSVHQRAIREAHPHGRRARRQHH